MMKEFPRRFLSLREKGAPKSRSRSPQPGTKTRPLTADAFRSLFKNDPRPDSSSEDERELQGERLEAKVKDVRQRLDELEITHVSDEHIRDIMFTKFVGGDVGRAMEFIDIEQKASEGTITKYNPNVEMVGAENRNNVTCYLDALLFAMFAKMDAFECILKNDFPEDNPKSRLVTLLRIWVNMLRSGKLIHTDLTKLIQDALADCGWLDAREIEQQDTSEAFAFITETLQLPLLSLQVDLFHQGKRDEDDHKVVYERLLNLAVPESTDGKELKLEDCLEEYFNTQVDVMRDSEEAKKSMVEDPRRDSKVSLSDRKAPRVSVSEIQTSPMLTSSPITISPTPETPKVDSLVGTEANNTDGEAPPTVDQKPASTVKFDASADFSTSSSDRRPPVRHRSTSVIQNVVIDEQGRASQTEDSTLLQKAKKKGSTVVKAVTIPAWQFFRLIPWNALSNTEPKNDKDVAMNFEQRPVVGICLKRYAMDASGRPKRHNTYIDIPDSLRLPRFMLAEGAEEDEKSKELNTGYKLVLQSVICHRGDALWSGHYFAFARVAPKLLTDNRRHDFDPPPDYEEAQWVKFDDLDPESRVSYVDDIKESLKVEMPYLLFYQVVPMVEAECPSPIMEEEPPSYTDELHVSIELPSPPTASTTASSTMGGSKLAGEYFGGIPLAKGIVSSPTTQTPRLSAEFDRSRRSSDRSRPNSRGNSAANSPRHSMALQESLAGSPALTPERGSPVISPADETTASRLSRAAYRFRTKNSRPSSQSGENRIGMNLGKLGGLMLRASKEPLKEPLPEPNSLSLAGSSSTNGRLSSDAARELNRPSMDKTASDNEKTSAEIDRENKIEKAKKTSQKNGKNKVKIQKVKSDQPERECTVM